MSEPLRFGVLGCASIAVRKMIPAIARSQRCEVVAIASRDAGRASVAATDLGIRATTAPTTSCSPIPTSRLSTSRCPTICTRRGRYAPPRPASTCCARNRWRLTPRKRPNHRGLPARGRRPHGSVHVPRPSAVDAYHKLVNAGSIGELRAIQAFFSYRNLDPENIRNIAKYGGGALMDIGATRSTSPGGCSPESRPTSSAPCASTRVRDGRALLRGARLRRAPRHVHLLDAGGGRPAGAHRRDRGPLAGGDPVQHPARPADAIIRPPAATRPWPRKSR